MGIKTQIQPWAARIAANAWLGAQAKANGLAISAAVVREAATAARSAAGSDGTARREHAFAGLDQETGAALQRLRKVVRDLRGIERRARALSEPLNLHEAIAFPPPRFAHWPVLRDIEEAAARFASALKAAQPPPPPKRKKGQRASAEAEAASHRYVAGLFAKVAGHLGEARDFAITEIAIGRAPACADAAAFRDRCKRWSKFTASRAA